MSRCRTDVVFVLFGLAFVLAGVPSDAGAQDRRSHWGVTVGFSPRWATAEVLKTPVEKLLRLSSFDLSGSEFRAGFVRGSELAGDAGISFVRRPFEEGSRFVVNDGAGYATRGVILTGVEAHKFTPFATIRDRVQIGLDYGAGAGVLEGVADSLAEDGTAMEAVPVQDVLNLRGVELMPIARVELAAAVIAAPGLKVRVKGGINFPGMQTFSVSVNYLFGAR